MIEEKEDDLLEGTELYEHHRFEVDKKQGPVRIDKFIFNRVENSSRNRIQAAADAGNVLVNGKAVKSSYKVKPCDIISVMMSKPPREFELIPEDIPLNILYEDDHLLIVNKEAGMVVHPAHGNYTGTLVHALAWHLRDLPLFKTGELRPGLVHRIDKNTSGILVIAKTELALNKLARQFFDHTCDRRYQALVWGNLAEDEGTITGNIGRSPNDRKIQFVYTDPTQGKEAITHYKVLERFGYVTLVECKLETGRTHQIRVHFKFKGNPLFGDPEYGGDSVLRGTTFTKYRQFVQNCFAICPRQALHAKTLSFTHPETGKWMEFESDLPADMQALLAKWRRYTAAREFEENDEQVISLL